MRAQAAISAPVRAQPTQRPVSGWSMQSLTQGVSIDPRPGRVWSVIVYPCLSGSAGPFPLGARRHPEAVERALQDVRGRDRVDHLGATLA